MPREERTDYRFIADEYLVEELSGVNLEDMDESTRKNLQDINKRECKQHKKRVKNYTLHINKGIISSEESEPLRLVLIGKTGVGKSATANTILEEEAFVEDSSAKSVTRVSTCVTRYIMNRKISVTDTPGLQDTDRPNTEIIDDITRIIKNQPQGIHAFLYVLNIAEHRFTKEDVEAMEHIEKTFGGDFKKYCMIVYTRADAVLKQKELTDYCKKRTAESTPIGDFLKDMKWRIVAVDNKTTVPAERERNWNTIIAMVDKMRKKNSPPEYTNEMFKRAQEEMERIEEVGKKSGWNRVVMETVQQMLAEDPTLAERERDLGKLVYAEVTAKLRQDTFDDELRESCEEDIRKIAELLENEATVIQQSTDISKEHGASLSALKSSSRGKSDAKCTIA